MSEVDFFPIYSTLDTAILGGILGALQLFQIPGDHLGLQGSSR